MTAGAAPQINNGLPPLPGQPVNQPQMPVQQSQVGVMGAQTNMQQNPQPMGFPAGQQSIVDPIQQQAAQILGQSSAQNQPQPFVIGQVKSTSIPSQGISSNTPINNKNGGGGFATVAMFLLLFVILAEAIYIVYILFLR